MSKKFLIITSVLAIIGIVFQIFLSGTLSSFQSVLQSLILGFLVSLFGVFFRGKRDFIVFVKRYSLIFLSLSGVFSLFLFLLASLSNLFPASLSEITLSNGKSTLVFVEMSHIASERYYREVNTRLRSLAGSGYTLYLEGVRPGTPENSEKFQKLLGIKLEGDTYGEIARMFGLTAQDASLYDGISTGSLIRADLSIDDIMAVIGTGKLLRETPPADIGAELEKLSLGESPLFHFIMRGVLNLSLRASTSTDILMDALDQDLLSAILDRRNAHIVSLFEQRGDIKAVFIYGALHFEGIYTLLREQDRNWNIVDYTPLYPYVR